MQPADILRKNGLRATPHRLALLGSLATARSPKTAEELRDRLKKIDLVTVYRNMQSLVSAGLVREVRFKDTTVRYEFADDAHHHHLVCTTCGLIDELPECDLYAIEKKVLAASRAFTAINEHSLEFFGTCMACAKR